MKISIESARAGYMNTINNNLKSIKSAETHAAEGKFDSLVISADSRKAAEEQLKTAAKKDVESTVFKPVSDEKIAALKQQVADGMYKVDPEAIAAKIVMFGGR